MRANVKCKILIVDDIEVNRAILRETLRDMYEISEAESGLEALSLMLNGNVPDLVLLDVMMPEMDGFEVFKTMKNYGELSKIPVMFITAAGSADFEIRGLELGASDYISKPINADAVRLRVANLLDKSLYWRNMEDEIQSRVEKLTVTTAGMLEIMAEILAYRDTCSGQHVKRTQLLMDNLLLQLLTVSRFAGVLADDRKAIVSAAPLHDIGKIAIPDSVLLKPGRLTKDEHELIKRHTIIGGEIMDRIRGSCDEAYYEHGKNICLYHHEHWDGSGYPFGLKGEEIPLPARIMAIIDVYDALVSKRPYKKPLCHEEALQTVVDGAGTKFDPEIVGLFREMTPGSAARQTV